MMIAVAVGHAQRQLRVDDAASLLGERLVEGTVYALLARIGDQLFPDDYLADLYENSPKGRPTVPARVLCTAVLLQAFEGTSDRETVDRLCFDLRWKAAAGLPVDAGAFHPTVLCGIRNRLRASARPGRLFEDIKTVARQAGLLRGRRRVVDSTPLLDAVTTQDTVTQLRAAIRKVLQTADRIGEAELAAAVRGVLERDDDYATAGKPACDWDDRAAREALVDALVRDCLAVLGVLEGRQLPDLLVEAFELLALVSGQDVVQGEDGVWRIARRVAPDRVISTVDTQARHGRKSRNRTFDGYRAHLAADPDDELITDVAVTAANVPDRDALDEIIPMAQRAEAATEPADAEPAEQDHAEQAEHGERVEQVEGEEVESLEVYGDSAYADAETLDRFEEAGHDVLAKVPPTHNRAGRFSKDDFDIDLEQNEVTCPAGKTAVIVARRSGGGQASFAPFCGDCPLLAQCTAARNGRKINIHRREATLQKARARQKDPAWKRAYQATRPIIERKIAHFVRRPWGGRRARCRGKQRILTDVLHRGAALNLSRLAVLGLRLEPAGWAVAAG